MNGKVFAVFGLARTCRTYGVAALLLLSALAHAQAPTSTYKLHTRHAIKSRDGLRFHWAMAPDASLLITIWEPRDQWRVIRLRNWETDKTTAESLVMPVNLPYPGAGYPPSSDPLISPDGSYLVIRSPEANVGENDSDKQKWQGVVSVIDLRTFTVASTVTAYGGLAGGGHLFFGSTGALMLHTISKTGNTLPFAVTVFSLPSMDRIASCDYQATEKFDVTKTGETCPAVMEAAHLSNIQQLGDLPPVSEAVGHLGGTECDVQELAPAGDMALYRCGKEHFGDPYGDFSITFWHALKVLATPNGQLLLSFPLRFNDRTSSGLFARKNGHNYLIVRKGSRLFSYEISLPPHT